MMIAGRQHVILSQFVLSESLSALEEVKHDSEVLLEHALAIADHRARWPRGEMPVDIFMLLVAGFLRLAKSLSPEKAEALLVNAWNGDSVQRSLYDFSTDGGHASWMFADELLRGLTSVKADASTIDSAISSLLRQSKMCAARLVAEPSIGGSNVAVLCAVFRSAVTRASATSIEVATLHTRRLSESVLTEVDAQSKNQGRDLTRLVVNAVPTVRDPFCTKEVV